jgi:hypothetical protein
MLQYLYSKVFCLIHCLWSFCFHIPSIPHLFRKCPSFHNSFPFLSIQTVSYVYQPQVMLSICVTVNKSFVVDGLATLVSGTVLMCWLNTSTVNKRPDCLQCSSPNLFTQLMCKLSTCLFYCFCVTLYNSLTVPQQQ